MGLPLGLLVLSQQSSGVQLVGIALVLLAGAGAQRGGRREAAGTGQDRADLALTTAMEPT